MVHRSARKPGLFLLAALLVSSFAPLAAQEASVRMQLDTTFVRDGVRGSTKTTGWGGTGPLAIRESHLLFFAIDAFDIAGHRTGEDWSFGEGQSLSSLLNDYGNVWTFECSPASISKHSVTVDVRSRHYESATRGTSEIVEEDAYQVALAEGERSIAAHIRAPNTDAGTVDFVVFLLATQNKETKRSEK